jgi:hypothetical protein
MGVFPGPARFAPFLVFLWRCGMRWERRGSRLQAREVYSLPDIIRIIIADGRMTFRAVMRIVIVSMRLCLSISRRLSKGF